MDLKGQTEATAKTISLEGISLWIEIKEKNNSHAKQASSNKL